jgi:hypothetical protein
MVASNVTNQEIFLMAQVKELTLRFRNPPDAAQNNIRIRPAGTAAVYDTPVDTLPAPVADADGFSRIPLANIPQAAGLEGQFDIHVTALDTAGNESDFLEIDNQTFDISPPAAPTDGSLE